MKKTLWIIIMLFLAVCGLYSQNKDTMSGMILKLTGNVELKPAGSSAFIAAKAEDTIALDTIISTGFRSTAVIAVNNSVITIHPLTQLSLAESATINLQVGRITVDSETSASCTVKSSDTTSLVRGTSFEFDTVNMKVNKGKAMFSGTSGPAVIVLEGREDSIGADGKPSGSAVNAILPSAPGGSRGSSSSQQPSAGSSGTSCCD